MYSYKFLKDFYSETFSKQETEIELNFFVIQVKIIGSFWLLFKGSIYINKYIIKIV